MNAKGFCKKHYGEASKDRYLRKHFGIGIEDYLRMHVEQGGVCRICRRQEGMPGRSLAVDHCHTTGRVRGLLCGSCNKGMGHFQDNPDLLEAAIAYLRGTQ